MILRVGGLDLASRSWGANGTAQIAFETGMPAAWVSCDVDTVRWPSGRTLTPQELAGVIDRWALDSALAAVAIDGPQAWRDPDAESRPGVGRWCELEARTPGKTGRFGQCFPATYTAWVQFSIEVFELLLRRPHVISVDNSVPTPREPPSPGRYYVLECFPTSTWRASGLLPLPGHAKADASRVRASAATLWRRFGLPDWRELDHHDHLQAVVAAVAAAAVVGGPARALPRGLPLRRASSRPGQWPEHWIEGTIWDARPAGDVVPRGEKLDAVMAGERASELVIERGVALFRELAERANAGEAVGVGYAQFACLLHGVSDFAHVAGHAFRPSDSTVVIELAHEVTRAAGGRIVVTRGATSILAGMDSFVWSAQPPHERPIKAWSSRWGALPYTPEQWRRVFPDGLRRLYSDGVTRPAGGRSRR